MTSCEKCRICGERNIVEYGENTNPEDKITAYRCYVCKGINQLCQYHTAHKNIVLGYDPAEV